MIIEWNKLILGQASNQKTQTFNSIEQLFEGLKTLRHEQQIFPIQLKITIKKKAFDKGIKGSFFKFMYHLNQEALPTCEIEKQNIFYQLILNND